MSELLKEVEANICNRQLLRRGQSVLVAVSGGVDSMVLLDLLRDLAGANHWRLTIAHLNHQLRGRSSNADERLVRQTARRLKLPVVVERAKVREFARKSQLSIEMAARKLRHDFLARTASRLSIPTIALAHHLDDQVELFFLRLLRGSGGQGMGGMKWENGSPSNSRIRLVRPLLDQPKAALRKYAAARKMKAREDASNVSLDFQRNRIRHELIPLLRRNYQPGLDSAILRAMEIIGAESECVAEFAKEWLRGFSRISFEKLHAAVQRRCLQEQLFRKGVAPGYELIEELRLHPKRWMSVGRRVGGGARDRQNSPSTRRSPSERGRIVDSSSTKLSAHCSEVNDAQGMGDSKSAGHLSAAQSFVLRDPHGIIQIQDSESAQFRSDSTTVYLKERAGAASFGGLRIQWRFHPGKFPGLPKWREESEVFDAERLGAEITLRHWRPGDRFQPIGMKRSVKLQDLFTNARIPASRRKGLVLAATARGDIFWVERLRISERYKLSESTIRRLQWRWHRL